MRLFASLPLLPACLIYCHCFVVVIQFLDLYKKPMKEKVCIQIKLVVSFGLSNSFNFSSTMVWFISRFLFSHPVVTLAAQINGATNWRNLPEGHFKFSCRTKLFKDISSDWKPVFASASCKANRGGPGSVWMWLSKGGLLHLTPHRAYKLSN